MAVNESQLVISLIAGADLSAQQYRAVKFNATGVNRTVEKAAAATDAIVGIQQNDPVSGDAVLVGIGGEVKAQYGGAVDAGDYLTSDANGKLIATTTAGNSVIAQALEDGADGEIHSVIIDKRTIHA